MKILLTAINAKYIHSNPAVYSLRAYATAYSRHIEIAEYTINHRYEELLAGIYKKKPDIIAFSCYIWNMEYIRALLLDLPGVLPDVEIWLGGPEVSYDGTSLLEEFPQVTGVMQGEGEQTFQKLMEYYIEEDIELESIPGIAYRVRGQICSNVPAAPMNLDELPFIYEDMDVFENRILYYETSRGCPFSCSYCLSSIEKKVRFRSLDLVKKELQFFLNQKVKQVKFVDRTFNCSHSHAMGIWKYLYEHDNGMTNFHFEISADLLNEEELELVGRMRPGLIQLEIGVQSVNADTIDAIERTMDFEKLKGIVERIRDGKNIHQHLDLIAGLPHEGAESFRRSFNQVYDLKPDQLQLGFLKVLKGSKMAQMANEFGIVYTRKAPYEVLSTRWLSFDEILNLKRVEEMVEIYYNSGQFVNTVHALVGEFKSPYHFYECLAEFYESHELIGQKHSRLNRYTILLDFIKEYHSEKLEEYKESMVLDLYLRENLKSRPAWAADLSPYKERIKAFYKREKEEARYLKGYEGYNYKQISKMTHVEVFSRLGGSGMLFDYAHRNPLNHEASVYEIEL